MRGGESCDDISTDGIGAPELWNVRWEERGFKIANLSIILVSLDDDSLDTTE